LDIAFQIFYENDENIHKKIFKIWKFGVFHLTQIVTQITFKMISEVFFLREQALCTSFKKDILDTCWNVNKNKETC